MARQPRQIHRNGAFCTYAYLYEASWNAFETAQQVESGGNYHLLYSHTFAAFTIEAYLNHVGEIQFPTWSIIERKLTPHEKLQMLDETLELSIDYGSRPFQTFRGLFTFRNFFAHGRTQYFDDILTDYGERDDPVPDFDPVELERLNNNDVQRVLDDTKAMIEFLHDKSADSENPIWLMSSGMTIIGDLSGNGNITNG